jgi:hypothetical protein
VFYSGEQSQSIIVLSSRMSQRPGLTKGKLFTPTLERALQPISRLLLSTFVGADPLGRLESINVFNCKSLFLLGVLTLANAGHWNTNITNSSSRESLPLSSKYGLGLGYDHPQDVLGSLAQLEVVHCRTYWTGCLVDRALSLYQRWALG